MLSMDYDRRLSELCQEIDAVSVMSLPPPSLTSDYPEDDIYSLKQQKNIGGSSDESYNALVYQLLYPHTGQLSRYAWSLVFSHLATGRTQGLTQALLRQRPAESAEIVRLLAYCNSSAWRPYPGMDEYATSTSGGSEFALQHVIDAEHVARGYRKLVESIIESYPSFIDLDGLTDILRHVEETLIIELDEDRLWVMIKELRDKSAEDIGSIFYRLILCKDLSWLYEVDDGSLRNAAADRNLRTLLSFMEERPALMVDILQSHIKGHSFSVHLTDDHSLSGDTLVSSDTSSLFTPNEHNIPTGRQRTSQTSFEAMGTQLLQLQRSKWYSDDCTVLSRMLLLTASRIVKNGLCDPQRLLDTVQVWCTSSTASTVGFLFAFSVINWIRGRWSMEKALGVTLAGPLHSDSMKWLSPIIASELCDSVFTNLHGLFDLHQFFQFLLGPQVEQTMGAADYATVLLKIVSTSGQFMYPNVVPDVLPRGLSPPCLVSVAAEFYATGPAGDLNGIVSYIVEAISRRSLSFEDPALCQAVDPKLTQHPVTPVLGLALYLCYDSRCVSSRLLDAGLIPAIEQLYDLGFPDPRQSGRRVIRQTVPELKRLCHLLLCAISRHCDIRDSVLFGELKDDIREESRLSIHRFACDEYWKDGEY